MNLMKIMSGRWRRLLSLCLVCAMLFAMPVYTGNAEEKKTKTAGETGGETANPGNLQWSFDRFTADTVYKDSGHTVLDASLVKVSGAAKEDWVKDYLKTQGYEMADFSVGTRLAATKKGTDGFQITYCGIGLLEENGIRQSVDMQVSLLDWKVADSSNQDKAFVLFSTCVPETKGNDTFPHDRSAIGVWVSDNVSSIDLRYTFFLSGTDQEVKVNGTFTQVDLDYLQYFAYEKTTSNIQAVHCSEDDGKVWADGVTPHITIQEDAPEAGWTLIQSSRHGLDATQEDTYRAGYVSSEFCTSSLSFRFGTKAALNTQGELKQYYFGILPYSIASYKEPTPTKYVSGDGKTGSYQSQIYKTDGDREIHYISSVYLPRSLSANYNSFCFMDTLNDVLDVQNAYISVWKNNPMGLDQKSPEGAISDVTDLFRIERKGQTIVVTARDTSIKETGSLEFFGNSYQLEIITSIKDNINLEEYVSSKESSSTIQKKDGCYVIPNQVHCTTGVFQPQAGNGAGAYVQKTSSSNTVHVYYTTPELSITKTSKDAYYNVGDTIHYEISVSQTKKGATGKQVFVTDSSLPEYIELVEGALKAEIRTGNERMPVAVQKQGNGFETEKISLAYGEKLVVEMDALAKQATPENGVTNIAKVQGAHMEAKEASATVYVSAPRIEVNKRVISSPSAHGTYQVGERVKYQIQAVNPVKEAYVDALKITDQWEEGMQLQEESLKVYYCFDDADANHPTKEDQLPKQYYSVEQQKDGFIIRLMGDLERFWGVGTIVAEYETVVTKMPENNEIRNQVLVSSANTADVRDEEMITVGAAPGLRITKSADRQMLCVGEQVIYTVLVENTGYYGIADLEIKDDTLPEGFVLKDLQVSLGEKDKGQYQWGNPTTGQSGFVVNKENQRHWRIAMPKEQAGQFNPGRGIRIQAIYETDQRICEAKQVNNTAIVKGTATDGTVLNDKASASVTIQNPQLSVEKHSDKEIYGAGEVGVYTVTISQALSQENQNCIAYQISLNDSLEQTSGSHFGDILWVSKVQKDGTTLRLSEEDYQLCQQVVYKKDENQKVSASAEGTKTDHAFGICTTESLQYGEKLLVCYEVLFDDPTSQQVVNTASARGINTGEVTAEHKVVIRSPKLQVTKTSNKKYYNFSENAQYRIVITQTEKATAKNVVLTDVFDLDDSFVRTYLKDIQVYDEENQRLDKNAYVFSRQESGYTIQFQQPLGYQESYQIVYSFGMYAPYEEYGEIRNLATVTADNAETVSASCLVACYLSQLEIVKEVEKENWCIGDGVRYHVEVRNVQSKTDAIGVEVTDSSLPASMELLPETIQAVLLDCEGHPVACTDVTIQAEGNGWTIKKDILAYGYTLDIQFAARAKEDALGKRIMNRAYAYADNCVNEVMDMAEIVIGERQDYKTAFRIQKKIKASDIYYPHGVPTFVITLRGQDIFGKSYAYNEVLEFTEAYVSEHVDEEGFVSMTAEFKELPMGTYSIEESACLRYRLCAIENVVNGTRQGERILVDSTKIKQDSLVEATFINEKYQWQQCSHTAWIRNRLQ